MKQNTTGSFSSAGGDSMSIRQAIETYELLAPQKRTLDDVGRGRFQESVDILMPEQKFIVLSTDPEYAGIHDRLFDAVHKPKDPSDLMGRLGDYGTNKVAMAMAIQDEEGDWFPTAVVYTYWSDKPDLPTHIRPILQEPITELEGDPKVIVPYTISSNFPKAGGDLITQMHGHIYGELGLDKAVLATLSPMRAGRRGFATWMQEQDIKIDGDVKTMLPHAFDYLMPIQMIGDGGYTTNDAVQSFHMAGKGAMLGAIRQGNEDSPRDMELAHGFMANYVYLPSSELMEMNKQRFREEGLVTVTPEFAEQVPEQYQSRLYVETGEIDDPRLDRDLDDDFDGQGLTL